MVRPPTRQIARSAPSDVLSPTCALESPAPRRFRAGPPDADPASLVGPASAGGARHRRHLASAGGAGLLMVVAGPPPRSPSVTLCRACGASASREPAPARRSCGPAGCTSISHSRRGTRPSDQPPAPPPPVLLAGWRHRSTSRSPPRPPDRTCTSAAATTRESSTRLPAADGSRSRPGRSHATGDRRCEHRGGHHPVAEDHPRRRGPEHVHLIHAARAGEHPVYQASSPCGPATPLRPSDTPPTRCRSRAPRSPTARERRGQQPPGVTDEPQLIERHVRLNPGSRACPKRLPHHAPYG